MAANITQNLEDNVACPICLDQYQDPRTLPCFHTYCRRCLEKLLDKGTRSSIQCPECREITQIEDVSTLKVNIWVNKEIAILELLKAEKKQDGSETSLMCNNCDSKEVAQARCFDCEKYMCNACFTAHKRISALKDHQLMTLEEIKNKGIPVIEKLTLCDKHKGKKQKLFCKRCEILICKDCTIVDHKDHDYCFIGDIIDAHKDGLTDVIKTANATREEIAVSLKSIKNAQEGLKENAMETENKIDEAIDEQVQALEEKRISLKQESRYKIAAKIKVLTAQEDNLAILLTSLTSAIEFTENVLAKGSNSEVLSVSKDVTRRLSSLSTKPFDGEVKDYDNQHLQVLIDESILADDGIEDFIRVADGKVFCPQFPDPNLCEARWIKNCFDADLLIVEMRNWFGRPPTDFWEGEPFHADGFEVSRLNVPSDNAWVIQDCTRLWHKPGNCDTGKRSHHRLQDINIIVDGKPIKNSPMQVCRESK